MPIPPQLLEAARVVEGEDEEAESVGYGEMVVKVDNDLGGELVGAQDEERERDVNDL
jgi:hypothetical protein